MASETTTATDHDWFAKVAAENLAFRYQEQLASGEEDSTFPHPRLR